MEKSPGLELLERQELSKLAFETNNFLHLEAIPCARHLQESDGRSLILPATVHEIHTEVLGVLHHPDAELGPIKFKLRRINHLFLFNLLQELQDITGFLLLFRLACVIQVSSTVQRDFNAIG